MIVNGKLSRRIAHVVVLPSWGVPDEISKMEPTAAIAAIQEAAKHKLLLGDVANMGKPQNLNNCYQNLFYAEFS